jgi:AraC family transcriptional regulator, regulatory protein of adaptative response / methylated-DNA-[protein]-cysteine methyltransferase
MRIVTLFDDVFDGERSKSSVSPGHYVEIEPIQSTELQNGLKIFYSSAQTMFGDILIAATEKGICHISFIDQPASGADLLKKAFPGSIVIKQQHGFHKEALKFFKEKAGDSDWDRLKLHVKGTPFQLSVWKALLTIPKGELTTYGDLAREIGRPKASRAVGSAVGKNPVAFIIPCHRVIASTGVIGNYRWGSVRKAAMVGRELAKKKCPTSMKKPGIDL